ncbi:hypothetical protein NECAME_18776 [Necator americanus]|uniref:Sushi domain-containing protein n=1 Tax=Necator americanus TaxID=51031 RepID=W2SSU6_NECAM|nr:hypothetical protein NECAME_18776 [Necator americanus]ETN72598.1 hypothetical protein NECAME_18776 [Necator americanus]
MTCPSGTPSGSTMATCTNGQWYPSTLGTCSSSIIGGGVVGNNGQCPTLTPPSGGTITMSSGLPGSPATQGTIATLTCSMGSVHRAYCAPMELGHLLHLEHAPDPQELAEVELLAKSHR